MTDSEVDELRQIAAKLYHMVEDVGDLSECSEPTGADDACPPCGCADCGWHVQPLRDDLLRLGVPI